MKNSTTILRAGMLIAMLTTAPLCYGEASNGKTTIKEVKKETQDLLRTLNAYTVEQKDEAVQKTKAALDDLDKHIDALEKDIDKSWDGMDEAARKKARSSLKEMRKLRTQAAEQYGSMKNSTADAWKHMKKGFSDAYTDLADAWEKSEKEFGSEE
jgi:signal transduction histidine kinase